jgi:hypothetical protein
MMISLWDKVTDLLNQSLSFVSKKIICNVESKAELGVVLHQQVLGSGREHASCKE